MLTEFSFKNLRYGKYEFGVVAANFQVSKNITPSIVLSILCPYISPPTAPSLPGKSLKKGRQGSPHFFKKYKSRFVRDFLCKLFFSGPVSGLSLYASGGGERMHVLAGAYCRSHGPFGIRNGYGQEIFRMMRQHIFNSIIPFALQGAATARGKRINFTPFYTNNLKRKKTAMEF